MLVRRVWLSLHEPRVVSALQVAFYVAIGASAVMVLLSPAPQPVDVTLGCVMAVVGSFGAAASAWRGWWGVETWTASMVVLGLATLTVEDVIRGLTTDHWPGWPMMLTVAIALVVVQRVLTTRNFLWEPGRGPDTGLSRAQTAVRVERALEADAIARAMEGRAASDNG